MGWTAGVHNLARPRFFSPPQHRDRLWGPTSLLSKGYPVWLPRGQRGQGVKMTTRLYLAPRSRMVELYLHSPMSSWHSASPFVHLSDRNLLLRQLQCTSDMKFDNCQVPREPRPAMWYKKKWENTYFIIANLHTGLSLMIIQCTNTSTVANI
jgi:hypothetical protein